MYSNYVWNLPFAVIMSLFEQIIWTNEDKKQWKKDESGYHRFGYLCYAYVETAKIAHGTTSSENDYSHWIILIY